ncbi:MAG TPA: PTS sugar transporter subunit IIB [Gemmatimonadales bacterium]|nr:PTS sugar transporter subunit IIB [Gemmatimonadales bacterium]
MTLVLCRIDDRLIHGQVVIGWGRPLAVQFIVLVDDQVAASAWEQELYRMAVPPEIEVAFATVAEATAQLAAWAGSPRRGVLLTGDVATMAALHRADQVVVHRINLGGLHHRPGRIERLPYVYLTDAELRTLRALADDGAVISAQAVPTDTPVPLADLGGGA